MPRQPIDTVLSNTALSNLFTMGASAKNDPRQRVPDKYTIPDERTRELRARLHIEEAIETAEALGFKVYFATPKEGIPVQAANEDIAEGKCYAHADKDIKNLRLVSGPAPNLNEIIDGCGDLIYVATGTMLVCGAPDNPHLECINRANNAKFPGGKAITDANGKFQKPAGWKPPNHDAARTTVNLAHLTETIVRGGPADGGTTLAEKIEHALNADADFKAYVHKRLDEAGVPTNPEPAKTAETGCRIGPRLDWLFNRMGLPNSGCSAPPQPRTTPVSNVRAIDPVGEAVLKEGKNN